MTTVFHPWLNGRFIEIQSNLRRNKLHKTSQGSNFPGGSFSQSQYLKRLFFLMNRLIHFHINSTSVIKPVKQNQLSFLSTEINKPLTAPVQCLVDQIQVQILDVATDQMPDHTWNRD